MNEQFIRKVVEALAKIIGERDGVEITLTKITKKENEIEAKGNKHK